MISRKHISSCESYEAGKPIEETKRQLGLKKVIKLASNENPLGVSPRAIAAIKKNLSGINRYPDSSGFYLKRRLSRQLGVEPACIVLGNGSDELISTIIDTFVEEDENIITADVTFLEYKIIARAKARKVVTVPMQYFKYDLGAIKKRIDRKTKAVFIANPNNPTGTYVSSCELDEFLAGLPQDILVVLDEAYDTFIDVDDFPNSLRYLRAKNVVILKTFSKAYGLAGLRLGYAIAKPELARHLESLRQPFNVNLLAQAAGVAALDDAKFLKKTRSLVLRGKDYLYEQLKKLGIPYVPSVANFILIDVGRDGVGIFKEMLKLGVIVRDMKQYGLKNFIRVTIGTKAENERFVDILKKVLRQQPR